MPERLKILLLTGVLLVIAVFFMVEFGSGEKAGVLGNGRLPTVTIPFSPDAREPSPASGKTQDQPYSAFIPGTPTPLPSSMPPPAPRPAKEQLNGDKFSYDISPRFEKLITPFLPFSEAPREILELPVPKEEELAVDTRGARNFDSYLDQFILKATNIGFPYQRYNLIAKDENGIVLSPERLVQKALQENDFSRLEESFAITKEFLIYKVNDLLQIKVTGDAISINKLVIGFDKLTIELMNQATAVARGKENLTNFESYYQKYNHTADYYAGEILKKQGGVALRKSGNLLARIIDDLGLREIAYAATKPFGGKISMVVLCGCELGLMVHVGDPVGGTFFISSYSSRIFANFAPIMNRWILGNYKSGSPTCSEPTPGGCVLIEEGEGTVTIAGTS